MIHKILFRLVSVLLPQRLRKQLKNFHILSVQYGQYQTIRRSECLNRAGDRIPWYTYPAIEFLDNLDFSQKTVLEYGSGNSSAFWAKRSKSVLSIEHDRVWFDRISTRLAPNQSIYLRESEGDYLEAVNRSPYRYDVIVIDGKYRSKCARLVQAHLAADGLVVLDNSDWWKETARYLREELDLIEVDFHGFGPINDYTWTTSFFMRRNVNLKPLAGLQPRFSISAIEDDAESL